MKGMIHGHVSRLVPEPAASHPLGSRFVAHPRSDRLDVSLAPGALTVRDPQSAECDRWTWRQDGDTLCLHWEGGPGRLPDPRHQLAALEAVFDAAPHPQVLTLLPPFDASCSSVLRRHGSDVAEVQREMLFQEAALWLPHAPVLLPQQLIFNGNFRHPRRPPKVAGVAYRRHIPWLDRTLTFRALDLQADLPRFSRWMNDPAVARVWQEAGDVHRHRRYLDNVAADPHMQSLLACLDDHPFGYFEAYWAKENRVAPFYDADHYDRGWHVLIGEPAYRGKAVATAWLTSISHYLFLADPRTRRIVGEPRADHAQQIRNLDRSGYAKVKEFDFPHKRALLVMLERERFFADALWRPRGDERAVAPAA